MRLLSLIPAVVALFVSGAASAQTWAEYVNRGDFFTVNLPGEPTVQEIMYKGNLPAHGRGLFERHSRSAVGNRRSGEQYPRQGHAKI